MPWVGLEPETLELQGKHPNHRAILIHTRFRVELTI